MASRTRLRLDGGRREPAAAEPTDHSSMQDEAGAAAPARVLATMRAAVDSYPTALGRIARYIADNPKQTLRFSVAELGEFSGAGPASVIRLCRKLGFDGYSDFKLALAADLARRPTFARQADKGIHHAVVSALQSGLMTAVQDIRDRLDETTLTTVADRLIASRRIDVYGAGGSGVVGLYLAFRLMRLRLTAQAFTDPSLAEEVANGLDDRSVAVGVSLTGVTPDTVHFLQNARISGATTVALTDRPASPITRHADWVLLTSTMPPETDGDGLSMSPRMFLAEILAAMVTLRQREAPDGGTHGDGSE